MSADPALQSHFTAIDWGIVAAYVILTTLIGARLSGKQATIRDFFLGGRTLPWWAICGSIVATEVSAAAFLTVPVTSFKAGGNLTYLQLAIGTLVARLLIGLYFVPRYYEREIYSPYDYMGQRLGPRVKYITTALFMAGAVLGQGARIYITAFVFSKLAGMPLVPSIWIMGGFSIAWTFVGGMTTVIWTDVIQFAILIIGAGVMLWAAVHAVPGTAGDVAALAESTGKLRLVDTSTDPTAGYTLWTGLLAMPFLNLAAFGVDQVMAQRIFCCKTPADARRAIIVSCVSQVIPIAMLAVGIAMFAYFKNTPFSAGESALYKADDTYLVPIFIERALPQGIRGLIVAAIFAASIATAAIAALSQTTLSLFFQPLSQAVSRVTGIRKGAITEIQLSRILVVFWGVILSLVAVACIDLRRDYKNAIDLVLSIVRYTYGPLLGIFLLAFQSARRDDRGLFWAVPISILTIYGMSAHESRADWTIWIGAGVTLSAALLLLRDNLRDVVVVVLAVLAMLWLHSFNVGKSADGSLQYLHAYWHYPIGTAITFVLGYALGEPESRRPNRKRPSTRAVRARA